MADNQAPILQDDLVEIIAGESVIFDVLENDSDPDDDVLEIESVEDAWYGELTHVGNMFTYKANPDFVGTDSFSYSVTDHNGHVVSATVSVEVKQRVGDAQLLNGTSGNDTLIGKNHNDTIYGFNGNDHLHGVEGNDSISGGDGHDSITGGDGSDTIYGGAGNDVIEVGDSSTETSSDPSSNVAIGDTGNDTIIGNEGNDYLLGKAGDDVIYSGYGNDKVSGGSGNDRIFDSWGNNILYADEGNDTIISGYGTDRIYTGTGYDMVDLQKNDGSTTIMDFEYGHDKIRIQKLFGGNQDFEDVTANLSENAAGDAKIYLGNSGAYLTLAGMDMDDVKTEMFEFY